MTKVMRYLTSTSNMAQRLLDRIYLFPLIGSQERIVIRNVCKPLFALSVDKTSVNAEGVCGITGSCAHTRRHILTTTVQFLMLAPVGRWKSQRPHQGLSSSGFIPRSDSNPDFQLLSSKPILVKSCVNLSSALMSSNPGMVL